MNRSTNTSTGILQLTWEDATDFFNKIIQSIDGGEGSYWAICLKENPRLVGTICLYDFSPDRQIAEIGYELLPFYQHKGIMQEALSVVLHYSFHRLNLETITAFPSADNKSSIKLLQKNEFKLEDDGYKKRREFRSLRFTQGWAKAGVA